MTKCNTNIAHTTNIIAENTENLKNLILCTIENTKLKIVRKSQLLLHKIGIFSSATAIVLQTNINCSYTRASKQQLTAHTSIVKGDTAKCYKHASFSSNTLLYSLVLKNIIDSITQNTNQINSTQNTNYSKTYHNGSFFLYKKQCFY